MQDPDLLMTW